MKTINIFTIVGVLVFSSIGFSSGGGSIPDVLLAAETFDFVDKELNIKELEVILPNNDIVKMKKLKADINHIDLVSVLDEKIKAKLLKSKNSFDADNFSISYYPDMVSLEIIENTLQ
jgi:hypothetical protein